MRRVAVFSLRGRLWRKPDLCIVHQNKVRTGARSAKSAPIKIGVENYG
jgi:hypothetical protein